MTTIAEANNRRRRKVAGMVRTFLLVSVLALFTLWIILKPYIVGSQSYFQFLDNLKASIIPWIIVFILLHFHLLNWKRIITNLKRIFMAHKENLEEFGYIASGRSGGDPVQFRSYLNGIYNGDISHDDNSTLTENHVVNIKAKIHELNTDIEENRKKIRELKGGEDLPVFDRTRFLISLFIFTGLTIFSYFFYMSTINKALFLKLGEIDCGVDTKLSVLPSQEELVNAIQNSPFILIVPFTVFALGWILHLVFDNNKLRPLQRNLYLGTLLSVTFLLDFLLATYIHKNLNAINVYCGFGEIEVWYKSTTFYIIIFMGFLVYIFWSLILHNIISQTDKLNHKKSVQKGIEKLQVEIDYLDKRMKREITLLEKRVGNIVGSIDKFHQGWNMFMNNFPGRFSENKEKCQEIVEEFNQKISNNHV